MTAKKEETAGRPVAHGRKIARWAAMGLLLVSALLLLAACGNHTAASQAKGAAPGGSGFAGRGSAGIPVQAATVTYGPLNAVHTVAGTVVPMTQSNVAAQLSGVVKKIVHNVGDWVTAGETVVQLDPSQLQLALQNAQVALKNAQINLTVGEQNTGFDTKKLQLQLQAAKSSLSAAQKNYDALESGYKQGNVAASDVDTAQSQLQTAEANYQAAQTALEQNKNAESQSIAQLKLAVQTAQNQLAQAQLNLDNASITAPFAGQISVVNVSAGEFVGQNTPAFTVVSAAREISFNVPPADAPVLKVATKVSFAVGGNTYSAVVNQTPSAPVNGVVPLTAVLDGTVTLPFGTVGTVSYPVTISTGTLVPLAALQNDGSQNYVFTIDQGKAHVQPITILGETGSTAAVGQLTGGTAVVLNPPPGLLEGVKVIPVENASSGQTSQSPNGQSGGPLATKQGGTPGGGASPQKSGTSQSGARSTGGRAHALRTGGSRYALQGASGRNRSPATGSGT